MKYFLSCLSLILLKIYHLCQAPKPFLFNIIPLSHKAQCKYCYTHLRDEKPRLNMVKQYSQYFQNKYLAEQEFKLWNIWLQNLYSFNKITYDIEKREKETKFTDLNGNTKELIHHLFSGKQSSISSRIGMEVIFSYSFCNKSNKV